MPIRTSCLYGILFAEYYGSDVRAFASSAPFGFAKGLRIRFDLGQELFALAVVLFVLGFAFGPLIWAPLSEQVSDLPVPSQK